MRTAFIAVLMIVGAAPVSFAQTCLHGPSESRLRHLFRSTEKAVRGHASIRRARRSCDAVER